MTGPVPELLAKKRRRDETWAAERAAASLEARKKARATRKDIFKRAETYVNEYRQQVQLWLGTSHGTLVYGQPHSEERIE